MYSRERVAHALEQIAHAHVARRPSKGARCFLGRRKSKESKLKTRNETKFESVIDDEKKKLVKEVWIGGEKRNCSRNNNLVDNWHNKINLVITFARLINLV